MGGIVLQFSFTSTFRDIFVKKKTLAPFHLPLKTTKSHGSTGF